MTKKNVLLIPINSNLAKKHLIHDPTYFLMIPISSLIILIPDPKITLLPDPIYHGKGKNLYLKYLDIMLRHMRHIFLFLCRLGIFIPRFDRPSISSVDSLKTSSTPSESRGRFQSLLLKCFSMAAWYTSIKSLPKKNNMITHSMTEKLSLDG